MRKYDLQLRLRFCYYLPQPSLWEKIILLPQKATRKKKLELGFMKSLTEHIVVADLCRTNDDK